MNRQRPTVIIEDVDTRLREKVEKVFDRLAPRTFDGMKVLVKPNLLGPFRPELGFCTHPEVVRAVVRACLDRGAKVTVGDNPGHINRSSTAVAQVTGILDASEGCFLPISDKVVRIKGAESGLILTISKAVLDADYVINVPVLKTHAGTYLSGAMKNLFGYVAGACKAQLHLSAPTRDQFAEMICDINQVRHPDLHLIDAITALEGNGPTHGGTLRQVGQILASDNAVAADSALAAMMGVDPLMLPVQKRAQERGFGLLDLSHARIEGDLRQIPDFKMPNTFIAGTTEADLDRAAEANRQREARLGERLPVRLTTKPVLAKEKCLQCGDCETGCPAGSLTLDPYPEIDDKCIACFCCVELCLEGAFEVPDIEAFRA